MLRTSDRASGCFRQAGLLLVLAWLLGGGTAVATDTLGTAKFATQTSCPAGTLTPTGTTCYKVTVQSCPGGTNFVAWLKVTKPKSTAKGTVLFMTGEDGVGWYDQDFAFGQLVTSGVVQGGYAAAQINFQDFSSSPVQEPDGWLTVLNGSNAGAGGLACRFATLANSYKTSTIYPGGHLGATGNSAGGALIAYALANYGLGTGPVLTLAEVTSGPPMARIDYGCLCDQLPTVAPNGQGLISECYADAGVLLDDTYAATPMACSGAETSHVEPSGINFLSASILSGTETTSYPQTTVNVLFAGQDATAAVSNGANWANAGVISAQKLTITTVPDARHSLPDDISAALQLITDLTTF